jgi:rhomboid protease GluP
MEEKSRMQLEKNEKRRLEQNKIVADIQKEKSSVENSVKSQTDLEPDTNTEDIIIKIIGFTCFVYINTLFRGGNNNLVMYAPLIQDGQIWRFVTPVFAHASLMHLATNMYVLYLLSDMCAVLYKKDSFLFRYIIFGIAGNILSFIFTFNNPVPCLGASGAILGVCGMLLGHQKNAKTGSPITFYNLEPMWVYIIISIVGGFTQSGVDNGAHIGGFAAGFYWGYNIIAPKENKI